MLSTTHYFDNEGGTSFDFFWLSELVEEVLLSHYFLLVARKRFYGSLNEFWDTDTFQLYKLLQWEHEIMEREPKPEDKPQNPNQVIPGRVIQDDPLMVDLFRKYVEDEDDDE